MTIATQKASYQLTEGTGFSAANSGGSLGSAILGKNYFSYNFVEMLLGDSVAASSPRWLTSPVNYSKLT